VQCIQVLHGSLWGGGPPVNVRMGVHSGPAVVVGGVADDRRNPCSYIFSNTVINTAVCMERTTPMPGVLHAS
jgi:class 3 adenylate cyclase